MRLVLGTGEPWCGEGAALLSPLLSGAWPSSPFTSPPVKGLRGALSRRALSRPGCSRAHLSLGGAAPVLTAVRRRHGGAGEERRGAPPGLLGGVLPGGLSRIPAAGGARSPRVQHPRPAALSAGMLQRRSPGSPAQPGRAAGAV